MPPLIFEGSWGKTTNGDSHTPSKYAIITNRTNKLLKYVISYLDKYTFIMTWKAKFRFKILEPLSCWNMAAERQMDHGAPSFFLSSHIPGLTLRDIMYMGVTP